MEKQTWIKWSSEKGNWKVSPFCDYMLSFNTKCKTKGLCLNMMLIRAFQTLGDNPKWAAILKVCRSTEWDPMHESCVVIFFSSFQSTSHVLSLHYIVYFSFLLLLMLFCCPSQAVELQGREAELKRQEVFYKEQLARIEKKVRLSCLYFWSLQG